jgi:hypothetical protein
MKRCKKYKNKKGKTIRNKMYANHKNPRIPPNNTKLAMMILIVVYIINKK